MTNQQKAAVVMAISACEELNQPREVIEGLTERLLPRAKALHDAGLLIPDVPEPNHNLVVTIGDCTFHASCSCGRALTPLSIGFDQSLDLFQPAWERHLMLDVSAEDLE